MVKNLYTSTVLKAFDILNCFQDGRQELGIKEISEKIGMPQSSIYHIVSSLEFIGLLFQNGETRKYRVGPHFIEMALKSKCLSSYQQIAAKYMKLLEAEVGENINLGISSGESMIMIHREECSHVLRPNFMLNTPYPAYRTGMGMVMLAEKSNASLEWIYENNRSDFTVSFQEFLQTIEGVRKAGYAIDDQLFCSGLRCVAVPVKGPGGQTLFAMSVSGPASRISDEICQEYVQLLLKYAGMIANDIQAME